MKAPKVYAYESRQIELFTPAKILALLAEMKAAR